jgi:hypothetical protein
MDVAIATTPVMARVMYAGFDVQRRMIGADRSEHIPAKNALLDAREYRVSEVLNCMTLSGVPRCLERKCLRTNRCHPL